MTTRNLIQDERGTSSVEFALIAPLLLIILLGIVMFGMLFGTYHSVQELTSQAARASIAGLTDVERDQLARSYIEANLQSYAFIKPDHMTITTGWADDQRNAYRVTSSYDLSDSIIYAFKDLVPLPDPKKQFSAVIQRGGY